MTSIRSFGKAMATASALLSTTGSLAAVKDMPPCPDMGSRGASARLSQTVASARDDILSQATLPKREFVDVVHAGEFLFRLRAAAGGKSMEERADEVEQRLVAILSIDDLTSDSVALVNTTGKRHGTWSIEAAGHLLITISANDVAASEFKAAKGDDGYRLLGEHWLSTLKEALPKLNHRPLPGQE